MDPDAAHLTACRSAVAKAAHGDGLVRRRHHQHRIAVRFECLQGGQRQRGRRVSRQRLQQQRGRLDLLLTQLLQHQEAMLLVADHERGRDLDVVVRKAQQARHRLLEQAFIATEHQELLGIAHARQGPQPRSAATGHDDGYCKQGHDSEPVATEPHRASRESKLRTKVAAERSQLKRSACSTMCSRSNRAASKRSRQPDRPSGSLRS